MVNRSTATGVCVLEDQVMTAYDHFVIAYYNSTKRISISTIHTSDKEFEKVDRLDQHRDVVVEILYRSSKHETTLRVASDEPPDDFDEAPFVQWLKDARFGRGPSCLRLPSDIVTHGDVQWFEELWNPTTRLHDAHIDALLNLLAVKFDNERGVHLRDWSILEFWCWEDITSSDIARARKSLEPFIRGSYPLSCALGWNSLDRVFGVGHINENHWVAYEINLRTKRITIHDPMLLDWDIVSPPFIKMSKHIPVILRQAKKGYRSDVNPLRHNWEVRLARDHLPQLDNYNCGVLSTKYVEFLANYGKLKNVDPKQCSMYRRQYCVMLHAYSAELPQPHL